MVNQRLLLEMNMTGLWHGLTLIWLLWLHFTYALHLWSFC